MAPSEGPPDRDSNPAGGPNPGEGRKYRDDGPPADSQYGRGAGAMDWQDWNPPPVTPFRGDRTTPFGAAPPPQAGSSVSYPPPADPGGQYPPPGNVGQPYPPTASEPPRYLNTAPSGREFANRSRAGRPSSWSGGRVATVVGSIVAVAAVVAGVSVWAVTRDGGSTKGTTTAAATGNTTVTAAGGVVTVCADAPTITPTALHIDSRGLTIETTATSPCSGGDVLSNSDTRVAVTSPQGLIAAGSFDFSDNPIALPPGKQGGRTLTLTFPDGNYFSSPAALQNERASDLSVAAQGAGAQSTNSMPVSEASGSVSGSVSSQYTPSGYDTDSDAGDALRRQATADRQRVLADSNNQWVAQLSSKQPGLTADGKTWTNTDILAEFMSFYQRFGGARLLWSDDWSVFSEPGWWVSITAQTFPSGQAAVNWCQQQGFDRDHCLGKLISDTAPVQGSTMYLPG